MGNKETIVRVGKLERWSPNKRSYYWVNAYTFKSEHGVEYPWCTFHDIRKEAKRRGLKAPRSAADVPYYSIPTATPLFHSSMKCTCRYCRGLIKRGEETCPATSMVLLQNGCESTLNR